jgi:hypothetical protein
MRWIDVTLPQPGECPELDHRLAEARQLTDTLPALQEQHGLDAPRIARRIEEIGQVLFQAVTAADAGAFDPDRAREGAATPRRPGSGPEPPSGYHVVAPAAWLGLPWSWLHNGVAFLLENRAVVAAPHDSRVPAVDPPRPWMERHGEALFGGAAGGAGADPRTSPEILFVPGHGHEEIRRLMFREADGIDAALGSMAGGSARLRIPGAVSPGLLAARAMLYQGLHFAAPTSQPPEVSGAGENRWLAGLMAAAGQEDTPDLVDDLVGLEPEILGVDPVEAVMDQALAAFSRQEEAVGAGRPTGRAVASQSGWLLEDGPVVPERLGRDGSLPPLVFSNSWCSLAWLGGRFLTAGASTFIGTCAPLFSRPARRFAAHFYAALADGLCAGAAHRQAALGLRHELGGDHPAWLAHGVQGYGALRLADL